MHFVSTWLKRNLTPAFLIFMTSMAVQRWVRTIPAINIWLNGREAKEEVVLAMDKSAEQGDF